MYPPVLYICALTLVPLVQSQICGDLTVPYSFRVNSRNEAELGCAQTDCVGLGSVDTQTLKPVCETSYFQTSCSKKTQWVGGLKQQTADGIVLLQCCTFEPLSLSHQVLESTLGTDQEVVGGHVTSRDGRVVAFDAISNVQQFLGTDGTVRYTVTVQRFPCVPRPVEATNDVQVRFPSKYKEYARALGVFLNLDQ